MGNLFSVLGPSQQQGRDPERRRSDHCQDRDTGFVGGKGASFIASSDGCLVYVSNFLYLVPKDVRSSPEIAVVNWVRKDAASISTHFDVIVSR